LRKSENACLITRYNFLQETFPHWLDLKIGTFLLYEKLIKNKAIKRHIIVKPIIYSWFRSESKNQNIKILHKRYYIKILRLSSVGICKSIVTSVLEVYKIYIYMAKLIVQSVLEVYITYIWLLLTIPEQNILNYLKKRNKINKRSSRYLVVILFQHFRYYILYNIKIINDQNIKFKLIFQVRLLS